SMAVPQAQRACNDAITAGINGRRNGGCRVKLHSSNSEPPMSHMGQSRPFAVSRSMSAPPAIADVERTSRNAQSGHVWTAPGWQEESHVASLVGAAMCSACERGSHDRWP